MSSSGFRVVLYSVALRSEKPPHLTNAASTVALSGEPTRLNTRKSFRTGGVCSRYIIDCPPDRTPYVPMMHVTGPVPVSAASVE